MPEHTAAGEMEGKQMATFENSPRNRPTALDAFVSRKAEIDAMLERLQGLSAEHFYTGPDTITWGHVETLEHYAGLLQQMCDSAFQEGEHAR